MKRHVARAVLALTRWRVDGAPPAERRYVVIAAPHTSNWDLLYLLMIAWHHDVSISWLGKESLFPGPVGWVLRKLGGIPVRRDSKSGLVVSLAAEFESADDLVIVIPPEGTRSYADHWKTGFYRVAEAAEVPIVCGYLDYERRVGGFGITVYPSSDIDADMARFREFYADKRGKYPDQASEVRLRPRTDGDE